MLVTVAPGGLGVGAAKEVEGHKATAADWLDFPRALLDAVNYSVQYNWSRFLEVNASNKTAVFRGMICRSDRVSFA